MTATGQTTINPGDTATIEISLTNSSTAAVTNLGFTDTLPTGLTVGGTGLTNYSCIDGSGAAFPIPGGSSVTATAGSGVIQLTGATLPGQVTSVSSCTIDVQVTSVTPGATLNNLIDIGDVTGTQGGSAVANTTAASQSINVVNFHAPTITKRFSPSTILQNDQTTTLTITIDNSINPHVVPPTPEPTLPFSMIRDIFTAGSGLQVAPTPASSVNCSAGGTVPTFTPAAGDTTLMATNGIVAEGGTCTLTVNLIATGTGTHSSASISNTIDRTADFTTIRQVKPGANATASLTVNASMQVTESFSPNIVAAGQSAALTIKLTNNDPVFPLSISSPWTDMNIDGVGAAASGLKISPTGASIACTSTGSGTVAVSGNGSGVADTGFTLSALNILPNGSCTITLNYVGTLASAGTVASYSNSILEGAIPAVIVPTSGPQIPVVNPGVSTGVQVVDQLTATKASTNVTGTVAPGNPIQFQVTVSNFSTGGLTNVVVTDTLPSWTMPGPAGQMTYLPSGAFAPSLSGGCSGLTPGGTSTTPTFTIATMNGMVNASPVTCTVTFYAMVPLNAAISGLSIGNTIASGAITGTTGGGGTITNAQASNTVSTTVSSPIILNQAFNPNSAFEGTVSTLTLTFANLAATPLTGASITDLLPAATDTGSQLVIASPANASSTCTGATITATPGASSFSMTGASIPQRGGPTATTGTGALGSCTLTLNVIGAAGHYSNALGVGALTGSLLNADGSTQSNVQSTAAPSASLVYQSALTATKGFSQASIEPGGNATVTVLLNNGGTGTLNGVAVTDTLPANMTVANPAHAYTTCASGTVNVVAGGNTALMSNGVISAGGQCSFLFDVTTATTSVGNWVNSILSGGITATGGVRNTNPVSATLTNSSTGSITIQPVTHPGSLTAPGQFSALVITLTNGGTALTNAAFTNYFTGDGSATSPINGMQVAASPNVSTTCTGGIVKADPGATFVSLSNASIPANSNCTVTVNVTLNTSGTVQDFIPPLAVTDDQGIRNTATTNTSLSALPNLGVVKTFVPAVLPVMGSPRTRLEITVSNPGVIAATGLALTDTMPLGLTIPSGANPTTTCGGGTVTSTGTSVSLAGGTLTGGSSCTVQIDVTAPVADTYTNTIGANAVTASVNGNATNNPGSATATLHVSNAAIITKSFNQSTVPPGTNSTLTVTIANQSAVTALTGVSLVDTLPAGLTMALSSVTTTNTCGGVLTAPASGTSITLGGGSIAAGGSCSFTVPTVSNVPGTYVNTIPASALGTNEGVTNQSAVTGTLIVENPPTVNKQFSPVSIAANGTSTLSIVLGNTNSAPITLLSSLVDTLPTSPAPIIVASTPAIGGTCTIGSVTAAAGSGTITYANGATIPAGGCTITVNVTGSTAGSYVNTFPVGALHTSVGDNVQAANATLTISPLGFISGKVFNDNALVPNGIYGGTDTPISGITVNLSGTSTATTTTDALGNYSFTGLSAGTYTVTMPTQPVGTLASITKAGTISGTGTAGTATASGAATASVSTIILTNPGTVASSPDNNFSVVVPSSISGMVFLDQNSSNTLDAGDTALVGVTVQLLDSTGTTVLQTATTDTSGNYSFTGLRPGTYSVREPTQPTGTANGATLAGSMPNTNGTVGVPTGTGTVPSAINTIKLPGNTASTGNNFAEVPTGRQIAGRVYIDANNNGLVEASELGIGGVTLNLTGTDVNSLPVTATTTTGSDGRYVFSGLAEGTYTVTEPVQPNATTNGITSAGSTGGTATAVSVAPSSISGIILTGTHTVSSENNFGEIALPLANSGLVSGNVYVDANNDGIFQAAEQGIAGVTVTLTGVNDNGTQVNLTTTTGANGSYSFANLFGSLSGYTITEIQPANYFDGKTTVSAANPGTATTPKPVAAGGSDVISKVVLQNNAQLIGYNFGELSASSIAGSVYVDANNNGIFDTGESPIASVTVSLTGTDINGTAVNLTTTTAADGSYKFPLLAASNAAGYTITEIQPSAYPDGKTTIQSGNPGTASAAKPVAAGGSDVVAKIVLQPSTQLTNYNFGELPTTSIAGSVYLDANNNGVFESGETGIAGVTITLTGTDINNSPVSLSTVTGSNGSYSFTKLAPSNNSGYTVTETQPSGYLDGKTTIKSGNPGSVTTAKPLSTGGSDVITRIVIAANANLTDYNFGETPAGAVSGFVYVDANNNGLKDSGEAAIASVAIALTGTDSNGLAVNLSTTTAADGSYSFTGLVPSNAAGYTVTETQPANYPDGKTTSPTGTAAASKPVAAGSTDTITKIVVAAGATLPNNNFGELSAASIAGFVYLDANNSGTKDGGESGISGVTLKLTGTSANGTPVSQNVSTAGDGSFSFTGLAPSDGSGYSLTEIQPAGYVDGKTTIAAGNPGSASSGKPVSTSNIDVISGIKLASGAALTNYLFGETNNPTLKYPIVTGYVWFDSDHSRVRPIDGTQTGEPGWTVQLTQNGTLICTVQTDGTGFYQFDNLHCPDYINGLPTGSGFAINFSKNGNTLPNVPISGGNQGQVPPTGGQIVGITLTPGDSVVEQDLPLDPAGVVYNSLTRQPVAGAVVRITGPAGFDPSTQLVGSTAAQTQVVGNDGLYQFLLQNNYPTGVYTLAVTAPAGYLPAPSSLLPACNGVANVGLFPTPALVQASNTAPGQSVPAQTNPAGCVGIVAGGAKTTQYYFNFTITHGGSAPILNNHIPLDPILSGGLVVTKTTQMENVSVGGLVPYTITVTNTQKSAVAGVDLHDQMPPGFKYRNGSATRNGLPAPPVVTGRALDWAGMTFAAQEKKTFVLLLAVGTGVGDGEYINQAWAANGPNGGVLSNIAAATVRIVPDPTFDCPDVIGKVFDDRNANGYQDEGELGIPGVRLSTVRGLLVTTDSEGRFHVPCPDIPNADRGSNFVMKLDDRTLPSGYRLTTENPRDIRLTAGKLSKLNFGATIHRVVRVELSDAAFEAGTTKLLPEWQKQIDDLPKELEKRPSVVRLAYARGKDPAGLVGDRVATLRRKIRDDWEAKDDRYTLMVETEESGE